jgi:hypothetical protein
VWGFLKSFRVFLVLGPVAAFEAAAVSIEVPRRSLPNDDCLHKPGTS